MLVSTPPFLDEEGSVNSSEAPLANNAEETLFDDNHEPTSMMMEEETDEWRMVSLTLETSSLEEGEHNNYDNQNDHEASGVLILAGEEAPLAEEDLTDEVNNNNIIMDGSDANLSLDGSVPTIVGGLEDLAAHHHHGQLDNLGHHLSFSLEQEKESEDNNLAQKKEDSQKDPEEDSNTAGRPREWFGPRSFSYIVMAFVASASTASSLFLLRERNSLLTSVAQLEQQVLELKEQAEQRKREDAAAALNWDAGCDSSHETTLVDNCWLSAKANVKLGDCAQDAKEAIRRRSLSLIETLEHLSQFNLEDMANEGGESMNNVSSEDSVAKLIQKMDFFGKALWSTSVEEMEMLRNATNTKREAYSSSFLSTMDHIGQSLWNTTVSDVSKFSNGMKDATSSFWKFFSSSEPKKGSPDMRSSNQTTNGGAEGVEDLLHGISELIVAASSFSAAAGEALIAAAVEKATDALDFNHTLKYLMEAVDEASLSHGIDL